jgi:hypothetical protein
MPTKAKIEKLLRDELYAWHRVYNNNGKDYCKYCGGKERGWLETDFDQAIMHKPDCVLSLPNIVSNDQQEDKFKAVVETAKIFGSSLRNTDRKSWWALAYEPETRAFFSALDVLGVSDAGKDSDDGENAKEEGCKLSTEFEDLERRLADLEARVHSLDLKPASPSLKADSWSMQDHNKTTLRINSNGYGGCSASMWLDGRYDDFLNFYPSAIQIEQLCKIFERLADRDER